LTKNKNEQIKALSAQFKMALNAQHLDKIKILIISMIKKLIFQINLK